MVEAVWGSQDRYDDTIDFDRNRTAWEQRDVEEVAGIIATLRFSDLLHHRERNHLGMENAAIAGAPETDLVGHIRRVRGWAASSPITTAP